MSKMPTEEFRFIVKEPDQQTTSYRYIGDGYDVEFEENIYQFVSTDESVRRHIPRAGITRWLIIDTWS